VAQLPTAGRALTPSAEELTQLKAKWGDVLYLRIADTAVVVRGFNEAEWDRFQGAVERGGANSVRATKDLLAGCVVWSSEPLDTILSRRPAYGKKYAMGLIEWAGAGDDLEKKEL
jgi:hypothetical protein